MPKLVASKEEITGQAVLPEGLYTVRLKGFKPKLDSKKTGVNLNPDMEVINHAEHNNRKVFDSLSTKAKWAWDGFIRGFGIIPNKSADGGIEFPGDFAGDANDPSKWNYVGPLIGMTAQVYIIEVPIFDAAGNPSTYQGNSTQNRVKYYVDATKGQQAASA